MFGFTSEAELYKYLLCAHQSANLLKAFEAIAAFFTRHHISTIGLPTHMLRTQAKSFVQNDGEFLDFRARIERLQIPQPLQDKVIKALLQSTNARDFLQATISLKEWLRSNFGIRFSKKQNIISFLAKHSMRAKGSKGEILKTALLKYTKALFIKQTFHTARR